MPALNMRDSAIFARYDLAYAMHEQGFPASRIMAECNYANLSSAYRAIKQGQERSEVNENRVSPRMFGVEIEFNRTSQENAVRGIKRMDPNFPVQIERYNHQQANYWKMVTDASVAGPGTGPSEMGCGGCEDESDSLDDHYDDCGCDCHESGDGQGLEIVSPILQGADGFRQLETVTQGIRSMGGGVDRTCGLHVHHDARDMTAGAVATLLRFYMDNQLTINLLLSPSRRSSNQWCKPWNEREKESICHHARQGGHLGNYDRYKTINVTSYPKYGSIEFRQHQGTLNYNKILNWVRFGQACMEAAMKADAAEMEEPVVFTEVASMLTYLVANGGLPKSAAAYLQNRSDAYGD